MTLKYIIENSVFFPLLNVDQSIVNYLSAKIHGGVVIQDMGEVIKEELEEIIK